MDAMLENTVFGSAAVCLICAKFCMKMKNLTINDSWMSKVLILKFQIVDRFVAIRYGHICYNLLLWTGAFCLSLSGW